MKPVSVMVLTAAIVLAAAGAAHAAGCAAEISAWRRAHGLSAVHADAALTAIAHRQAAENADAVRRERVQRSKGDPRVADRLEDDVEGAAM